MRHPFYERWECGALSRDEYRAIRRRVPARGDCARGSRRLGLRRGPAAEEAAHVAIWDDFAAELDADLDRAPHAETVACAEAWSGTGIEGAAALFVIESAQPDISRTKLEGLTRWYGFEPNPKGTRYSTCTPSATTSTRSSPWRSSRPAPRTMIASSSRLSALRANWELLDGVERFAGSRS